MRPESRYDSLFAYYGHRVGVEARFLKAVAITESALNPRAISRVGAEGLMQFMPATWEEWRPNEKASPYNPEDAIDAASRMLNWLFHTPLTDGNPAKVLAAYNWGYGNLRNAVTAHGDQWTKHAPKETRQYIRRVLGIHDALSTTED